jgi:hypothetical protein
VIAVVVSIMGLRWKFAVATLAPTLATPTISSLLRSIDGFSMEVSLRLSRTSALSV